MKLNDIRQSKSQKIIKRNEPAMNFYQSTPLSGYRGNLILSALIKLDQLTGLSNASSKISNALSLVMEPEEILDLVNQLAYSSVDQVVPELMCESVQDELMDMPISSEELHEILRRPIGSALQMFQGQQA